MPLHGEANAPTQLENLLVVGIKLDMHDLIQDVCEGKYGGLSKPEKPKPSDKKSLLEASLASEDRGAAMSLQRDEAHETKELSVGALEVYRILKGKKSDSFPRKALVNELGEEVRDRITELENAGYAKVGDGGMIKIIRELPKEVRVA